MATGCKKCDEHGMIDGWTGYSTRFCDCETGKASETAVYADWSRQQAAEIEAERRNEMALAGVVEYDEEATRDAIQCGIDYGVYDQDGNERTDRYATEEEFYRGIDLEPAPIGPSGFAMARDTETGAFEDCPF